MAEELNIFLTLKDNASKALKNFNDSLIKFDKNVANNNIGVKKFQDNIKNFGSRIKANLNPLKSLTEGFKKFRESQVLAIAAGNLLANAVTATATAFSNFSKTLFSDSIAAAQAQEDSINKLNTALKLSGDFSQEASEDIQAFASALQASSKFGDELILDQIALAKSFGITNDQAKELVQSAVDLSEATGITLESAVKNLGKTTGGLVGELGEVVPELKNLSPEALKAGAAIDFVANRFGGAAEAATQTFSGALARTNNIIGDFTEEIGFLVTLNPVFISAIGEVGNIFKELASSLKSNSDSIQQTLGSLFISFISGVRSTIPAITFLQDAIEGFIAVTEPLLVGFAQTLSAVFKAFTGDFSGFENILDNVKNKFQENINGFEQGSSSLQSLDEALLKVEKSSISAFESAKNSATSTRKAYDDAKDSVVRLTDAQKRQIEQGKALAGSLSGGGSGSGQDDQIALLQSQLEAQLIAEEEFLTKKNELTVAKFQEQQASLDAARQAGAITEQQFSESRIKLAQQETIALNKEKAAQLKFEQDVQKQKEQNLKASLNTIAGLQSSGNKTLFNIGRAAALAEAIPAGTLAVQRALSSAPPPFNFAIAAAVGVATAANIAKIASAKPPSFQNGGIVGGSSFSGDNVLAQLNSGEVVLNNTQQSRLLSLANGQTEPESGGVSVVEAINNLSASINSQPVMVTIDGSVVATAVRDQIESGVVVA